MNNEKTYNLKYIDKIRRNDFLKEISKNYFTNKSLKLFEYENITAQPLIPNFPSFWQGGLLDENFKLLNCAKIYPDRLTKKYRLNKKEITFDDREVIYLGAFWPHWGHFLVEQVSRLYYFLNEEKTNNLPIIYLSPKPLEGTFLEFIELSGIDTKRLIHINKPTKFKKIYIPEASAVSYKYYTNEYLEIFKKIKNIKLDNFPTYKKVFYTTRNFKKNSRKSFGKLEEIENLFKENGFSLISPESLTLKEQIAIMQNCEEFACIEGTLQHNLLFANENIKAYIINKVAIINPYHFIIDKIVKINPIYIDCHLSLFPNELGYGIYYYHISKNLENFIVDNNFKNVEENSSSLTTYFEKYLETYLDRKKYLKKTEYKKFKTYLYYINQIQDKELRHKIKLTSFLLCMPILSNLFSIFLSLKKFLFNVSSLFELKFKI